MSEGSVMLGASDMPSWREFRQAALHLDPDRQEEAADDLLAAGRWGRTPSRWAWPGRGPLKLHQVKLALTVVIAPGLHGLLRA